jgi:hypothetical protein
MFQSPGADQFKTTDLGLENAGCQNAWDPDTFLVKLGYLEVH